MINVLMFGWELPPNISGGLGTACYGLCCALAAKNALTVSFVLPRDLAGESVPLMKLIPMPVPSSTQGSLPKPYGRNMLEAVHAYAQQVTKNSALLPTFDVIHVHDWLTLPAGLAARDISGAPLVFHVHSTEYDRASDPDPHILAIEQKGAFEADLVLAVSERTKNTLVQRYHIPPRKIEVVYNGLNSASVQTVTQADRKLISFIGRVTHQKGPEYFVRAAALAAGRLPGYRFVLAGDGDLLTAMKILRRSLRLENLLVLPGFLEHAEVLHLLARSSVYVMPSVSEPFGIGALEAIGAGVPVIVSRQAGVSEVVSNLVVVDHWDIPAIADEIVKLATDQIRATQTAEAAKIELSYIGWEVAAASCAKAYASLLAPATVSYEANLQLFPSGENKLALTKTSPVAFR